MCRLESINEIHGDPCPYIGKTLMVRAKCSGIYHPLCLSYIFFMKDFSKFTSVENM